MKRGWRISDAMLHELASPPNRIRLYMPVHARCDAEIKAGLKLTISIAIVTGGRRLQSENWNSIGAVTVFTNRDVAFEFRMENPQPVPALVAALDLCCGSYPGTAAVLVCMITIS